MRTFPLGKIKSVTARAYMVLPASIQKILPNCFKFFIFSPLIYPFDQRSDLPPFIYLTTTLKSHKKTACKPCRRLSGAIRRRPHYPISSKIESPMVPFGIFTIKLSAMVAPITANVSFSGRGPPPVIEGDHARNGTFSLVWSVPL